MTHADMSEGAEPKHGKSHLSFSCFFLNNRSKILKTKHVRDCSEKNAFPFYTEPRSHVTTST